MKYGLVHAKLDYAFNDRKETINVHIVGMNGSLSPSPLIYCWHFELEEFLNCVHVITIKWWQIHDMKFNLWIYFDISTVSYAKFEISMCHKQRIGIVKIRYGTFNAFVSHNIILVSHAILSIQNEMRQKRATGTNIYHN